MIALLADIFMSALENNIVEHPLCKSSCIGSVTSMRPSQGQRQLNQFLSLRNYIHPKIKLSIEK